MREAGRSFRKLRRGAEMVMTPGAGSVAPLRQRGFRNSAWLGWVACALAAAGFAAILVGWLAGGGAFSLPWAPTLGLRLSFSLDGLGALYGLLATGIGALVFAYGSGYLPLHLEHEQRPGGEGWRFWPWMVLFAVAMVGLATAQDLILLFVFFDLTAVSSYFLIGFDRSRHAARTAALMALLVTVVSAVAILVAAVLLDAHYGTFSIPELLSRVQAGPTTTVAAALLAVGALAKSAQVPLHFWLPRAMEAPTPVSAYLHSAAMVAAGVLVLGRVHPLLARSELVMHGMLVVGFASIIVGGVLALGQDKLKQVLAYSTISQYGYVVVLYGIGGAAASGGAAFYVLAHGVAKSALFMAAGAVTTATGHDRLSTLGGLGRRMPVLAVATGLAAANLAGLPLTAGFFKDELFFGAATGSGPVLTVLAVVAAALTFAYIGRFWIRLFLGPARGTVRPIPPILVAPIAVLALISVAVGVVVQPFRRLAEEAGSITNGAAISLSPAYHLDARPANLMALAAWSAGGLLLAVPLLTSAVSGWLASAGDRAGPKRMYVVALRGLARLSVAVHNREVRDLRNSVAAVLVPGGLLTAAAFIATPTVGAYRVGAVAGSDWLVLPLLALVALAALAVARTGARLAMVLGLAVVGFVLAAIYALVGAADVALVAVLVESMITIVFLAALARLPRHGSGPGRPARGEDDRSAGKRRGRRWRNPAAGCVAGLAVFGTVWGFLSQPAHPPGVGGAYIDLTPLAHGKDVVTVIVADFRGLDTLVEITVLVVAIVGVATLLRRGRLW